MLFSGLKMSRLEPQGEEVFHVQSVRPLQDCLCSTYRYMFAGTFRSGNVDLQSLNFLNGSYVGSSVYGVVVTEACGPTRPRGLNAENAKTP